MAIDIIKQSIIKIINCQEKVYAKNRHNMTLTFDFLLNFTKSKGTNNKSYNKE